MIGRTRRQTQIVVVGSGPGGATVARECARRKKRVTIIERGAWHHSLGSTFGLLRMVDRWGFTFSQEGTWVLSARTVGGASMVFCGTAFVPPSWMSERYGIDIREEVEEARREIGVGPLPERLIGPAARRLMEAAQAIGLDWRPLDKFIRPDRCEPGCGRCMLGCPRRCKWTAREFVEDAVAHGASVLTSTGADRLLVDNGRATGVLARGPDGWVEIEAEAVVLAAGGIGTPVILQRSGVAEAGQGFFADPLVMTYGVGHGPGSWQDIPMTAGVHLAEDGIVMTDLVDPAANCLVVLARAGLRHVRKWAGYRRMLGIMTKVRDGLEGRVNLDGTFSKPITYEDRRKLDKGASLAERILRRAGADPDSIVTVEVRAAHPGGTVRLGHLLDRNLQTQIRNCYVADASAIPEPWGLPPTLTLIGLAKRLAKYLVGERSQQVEVERQAAAS